MAFGVYVHIPYCLQRCTYCDFATYEQSQIMPPDQYTDLILQEIELRARFAPQKKLDTVYFGGGTPSLISASHIVTILEKLSSSGFVTGPDTEITIEINPATVDPKKMDIYLQHGVNRFSVGAQTFNDSLLKSVHREHSAAQTKETLFLLQGHQVNYSFDVLFALPGQSLEVLNHDLEQVLYYRPNHISPYCLTVPEGHVLSKNKLTESLQLEMFEVISKTLKSAGYIQYEISNFCLPGFESKHNSLYWDDEPYWGIGLSAHSYFKEKPWGVRFWNPNSIGQYQELIKANQHVPVEHITDFLSENSFEKLELHQSITDFCHTSLRRSKGLLKNDFVAKYGNDFFQKLQPILAQQVEEKLLIQDPDKDRWFLSDSGILLSNQVFAALTFLRNEVIP